jgi:thiamine pyrophosphate-dependent acetolactate synthase large subunit-like protein
MALERPPVLPDVARFAAPSRAGADPAALDRAAALLCAAERPVIMAQYTGRAPAAVQALAALADTLQAPVVDLYEYGRFNFPSTHPLDLTEARAEILADADVILALDVVDLHGALARTNRATRTSESLPPPGATVIHISMADAGIRSWVTHYQHLAPVDLPILADTASALPALLGRVRDALSGDGNGPRGAAAARARGEALRNRHTALRDDARRRCEAEWSAQPTAPSRLAAEVWNVLQAEDWVLANGTLDGWARRLWDWTDPDQFVGGSGGAGLGYGAGAAIGAALAYRETGRVCVDLQPDGDLLYTPSALWTAAHHRIPVLFIMCNNRSYFNDEDHQALIAQARRRPVEHRVVGIRMEQPPVDFAALARGFGVHGEGPVEDPAHIAPAVRRALRVVKEEGRPALVDVVLRPE